MGSETTLDVSQLPPPEPLERVLEALGHLDDGSYLRMCHRREPFPLYDILRTQGFERHTVRHPDGAVEVYIWKAGDGPAQRAFRQRLERREQAASAFGVAPQQSHGREA